MKGDTLSSGRSIGQFPPPGFGCSAERVSLTRSDRCQTWKFSFHEYAGQTWDSSSDGCTSAKSFSWMSRNLRIKCIALTRPLYLWGYVWLPPPSERREEGWASSSADIWRPDRRLPSGRYDKTIHLVLGMSDNSARPTEWDSNEPGNRSHVGGCLKPPKSQRLRDEGECLSPSPF